MIAIPLQRTRFVRRAAICGFGLLAALTMSWSAHANCISPGFNPLGNFCNRCKYEGSMTLTRDPAFAGASRPAEWCTIRLGARVYERR